MSNAGDFIIENGVLQRYVGSDSDVVIPEGVTRIEKYAFAACYRLKTVVIPDSVTAIGGNAFNSCFDLAQITFGSGITTMGKEIFGWTCDLKKVIVPTCVASLLSKQLDATDDLRIDTPELSALSPKLRPCAVLCFAEDGGLNTDPRYESHIKYIRANAAKLVDMAMKCPSLLSLMCREKLIAAKDIEKYVETAQKTENAELITMLLDYQQNKLTGKQRKDAVKQKEKQENAVMDRIIARIDKVGISGLNFVVTGNVFTFENRKELKAFIESRGGKLQSSMSSKTDYLIMNMDGTDGEKKRKAEELGICIITELQFNDLADRQFVIDEDGTLIQYRGTGADVVIPEGVRKIGSSLFGGCNGKYINRGNLTNIMIPDSVISIGARAFKECSNLTNIVIPESVISIKEQAFTQCTGLTNVVIPQSVSEIGEGVFWGCSSLTCVEIPGSVSEIAWQLFLYCTNLTSVVFSDGVTKIGDAFGYCSSLTRVVIPESVTEIYRDAFRACNSVTIYGKAGSYAETYAKENNIPFVAE